MSSSRGDLAQMLFGERSARLWAGGHGASEVRDPGREEPEASSADSVPMPAHVRAQLERRAS